MRWGERWESALKYPNVRDYLGDPCTTINGDVTVLKRHVAFVRSELLVPHMFILQVTTEPGHTTFQRMFTTAKESQHIYRRTEDGKSPPLHHFHSSEAFVHTAGCTVGPLVSGLPHRRWPPWRCRRPPKTSRDGRGLDHPRRADQARDGSANMAGRWPEMESSPRCKVCLLHFHFLVVWQLLFKPLREKTK